MPTTRVRTVKDEPEEQGEGYFGDLEHFDDVGVEAPHANLDAVSALLMEARSHLERSTLTLEFYESLVDDLLEVDPEGSTWREWDEKMKDFLAVMGLMAPPEKAPVDGPSLEPEDDPY